jgi:hypothetical protein
MLSLVVPAQELYKPKTNEFVQVKETTLSLEHSLISLSKWEAQYKRPFLERNAKTVQETLDYIRCMTLNKNVDPNVYFGITNSMVQEVEAYILDPMTATRINSHDNHGSARKIITSELIYYWMITLNIPFECQKWHLNRLMTLIRVCNEKNKPKKMGKRELAQSNSALNAARRAALNSRG